MTASILHMCRINCFETMCPQFRDEYWNLRLADGPHYLLINGERVPRFDFGIARAVMQLDLCHDSDESLITQLRGVSIDIYDFSKGCFTFDGSACFGILAFKPL
jgi:hypothetical protein